MMAALLSPWLEALGGVLGVPLDLEVRGGGGGEEMEG